MIIIITFYVCETATKIIKAKDNIKHVIGNVTVYAIAVCKTAHTDFYSLPNPTGTSNYTILAFMSTNGCGYNVVINCIQIYPI